MAIAKNGDEKKLRVDWSAAQDEPAQPANVFVAQATPEFHVLNIGFVAPPVVLDDVDKQRARNMKRIPARLVARVVLTPEHMRQLVQVLSDNIASREKLVAQDGEEQ